MNQSDKDPAILSAAELQRSRVAVCVERHLQAELSLLEGLKQLNDSLASALNDAGATGLSLEQSKMIESQSDVLSQKANDIRVSRQKTLQLIQDLNDRNDSEPSIRIFIQSLSEPRKTRLEKTRTLLLDQLTDVHASMLGNQAVMFYTYDFNRKLVAGILGNDNEDSRYGVDGNSSGIKPGNLIQKAC